jgi:(1->4)-alpha-D-glucan 1-alpha-D-glucosylmutase
MQASPVRSNPRATYRVQLREDFNFDDATTIVPYLEALGVSHVYCSPYMQAAEHSPHGYDVVNPTRVSDALGGGEGLRRLDTALTNAGLGQLLDVVPNHVSIAERANTWWWDVLRNGRSSAYARFFDIDWDAPGLQERVLLPVLGAPRDEVLAARGLTVVAAPDGGFELHYEGSAFPLAQDTAATVGPVSQEILDGQHYILEFFKTGSARLNYRRFFDVSSLAGVRVEDDPVFDWSLTRALDLVEDGTVDGLRVDHIDGLRDPAAFALRLRSRAPSAWLIAEKILATGEEMPVEWPIDGTTGYEFGALLTSLMIHPGGLADLTDCYRQFTGDECDFASHSHRARREVMETLLRAELGRLARAASAAGIDSAQSELVALIAGMPRYRTYPQPDAALSSDDRRAIDMAERWARDSGACDDARLDALLAVLRGDETMRSGRELRERFQQVAGAVMAKGVEDTAFYRYTRLVALNEVGSDPDHIATLDVLHETFQRTARNRPLTLLATTTHDTKRSEDARLRIGLLSEMPQRWRESVERLDLIAARHRGAIAPARTAEYLFYQTLLAAQPIDADRAWAYMLKAAREAKAETSWIEPDQAYEAGLEQFVRGMIADPNVEAEIAAVLASMTPAWQMLSLSQTLITLTAPGVPDLYQGSELWDLRLVDPDNRTPVDYAVRRDLLGNVTGPDRGDFLSGLEQGAPKLRLIATVLATRARHAAAYAAGSGYLRVAASGSRADHAICFARTQSGGQPETVTIAFRWPLLLHPGWGDTMVRLPEGRWRDVLTERDIPGGDQQLATLLAAAPVALLERA